MPKYTKTTSIWLEPQILEAVGAKVRLVNNTQQPKLFSRHKHLSQILPAEETSSFTSSPSLSSLPEPVKSKGSLPFSSSVSIDPDNILPEDLRVKFRKLLQTYGRIFDPDWLQRRCWSDSSVHEHWPCTAPLPPNETAAAFPSTPGTNA